MSCQDIANLLEVEHIGLKRCWKWGALAKRCTARMTWQLGQSALLYQVSDHHSKLPLYADQADDMSELASPRSHSGRCRANWSVVAARGSCSVPSVIFRCRRGVISLPSDRRASGCN